MNDIIYLLVAESGDYEEKITYNIAFYETKELALKHLALAKKRADELWKEFAEVRESYPGGPPYTFHDIPYGKNEYDIKMGGLDMPSYEVEEVKRGIIVK